MKKTLSLLLATTMMVGILGVSASAAEPEDITVRVNGYAVDFPDAKPYVDENSRTMIPVRFATESLGAEVAWDNDTQTATIAKDGITVDVTIGSDTLKVAGDGKITTVEMDTEAIIKDSRTYVPIRFVAEALGAYVDYSDTYKTVGIYQDKLTAEEIAQLRAYPYTQSNYAISYADYKAEETKEKTDYYYGTVRDSFHNDNGFANAKEYLYHTGNRLSSFPLKELEMTLEGASVDTFYDYVVKEAVSEMSYTSSNIEFHFLADTSSIYQQDDFDSLTTTVRGIATVQCKVLPTELTNEEMAMVGRIGFNYIPQGVTVTMPVDVHMNTQANHNVNIHTIVPLAEQTPTDPTGGIS